MATSRAAGRAVNVLLAGIGALALLVAALGYVGRESAVAVVVPMTAVGLGAGVAAIACFGVLARRATGLRRRLTLAPLALALVILGLVMVHRLRAPREVAVEVANGDVRLAGTLYLPRSPGRHPAVVLIHGSGAETRDGHRLYGEYLARRGIAAAIYDKRGSPPCSPTTTPRWSPAGSARATERAPTSHSERRRDELAKGVRDFAGLNRPASCHRNRPVCRRSRGSISHHGARTRHTA